jgi:ubiquinone/menaquinone biosynthesis C-methylase UbiE
MTVRQSLFKVYWKMESLITPSLRYSQYEYEDVLNERVTENLRWLDLGCGHQMLPPWRAEQEKRLISKAGFVVGIDATLASLKKHLNISRKVQGNVSSLPFKDDSFDLVTANMVVEHLDDPRSQFLEVCRILRPDGLFIFHTPNARGYSTQLAKLLPEFLKKPLVGLLQGRPGEDVFPAHYRANTEADIERIAKTLALDTKEVRLVASSAQFAVVPPPAFLELLWIRLLQTQTFQGLRPNMVVTLQKRIAPLNGSRKI